MQMLWPLLFLLFVWLTISRVVEANSACQLFTQTANFMCLTCHSIWICPSLKTQTWFSLKTDNQCAYPPTKLIPTIQKHIHTHKHKDNCFLMISHYANAHHEGINLWRSFCLTTCNANRLTYYIIWAKLRLLLASISVAASYLSRNGQNLV